VIDIKTSDNFSEAYKDQMKLYKKAFQELYPDRKVKTEIFEV